jgi:hypothetical protein
VVLLRHETKGTEQQNYGQTYIFGYQSFVHNLALVDFAIKLFIPNFAFCSTMACIPIMAPVNNYGSIIHGFAIMTLSGRILPDIISGVLRSGSVPMRTITRSKSMVFFGVMCLILGGLTRSKKQNANGAKQITNIF